MTYSVPAPAFLLALSLTACTTTIIVADDSDDSGSTGNVSPPNPVGPSPEGGSGPGPGPGQGGSGPGPGPGQGGQGGGPGPGPGPGVGGSSGCYDESLASAPPQLPALAGQGLCTPEEVDDFVDSCLSENATQDSCDDFTNASPACSSCVGLPGSAMAQPVLLPTQGFIFFNSTSCEALAQGKPQCAAEATNLVYCVYNTCSYCVDFGFDTCLEQAGSGVCADYFPVNGDCESVLGDPQSPQCSGNDVLELVATMSNYMCGAP